MGLGLTAELIEADRKRIVSGALPELLTGAWIATRSRD